MKYARREFERKFLLERMPEGVSTACRVIHDRYFPNSTLRLRCITDADGKVVCRKLGQKRHDESGAIWLTTAYLSEDEFRLLEALPAVPLTKRRYAASTAARKFSVDVLSLPEGELLLMEIEGDSPEQISGEDDLPAYVREVTREPAFEGYQLALRAAGLGQQNDDTADALITQLDHVQLAMPAGEEAKARRFFAGVLGMQEETKPEALARRGGCWFRAGSAVLHLGVETPFTPQKKAHPAFCARGLDRLAQRLVAEGYPVTRDDALSQHRRLYTADPFGNRIELIEEGDGFSQRPPGH